MKKVTLLIGLAIGLSACGTTTVVKEVTPTTTIPVVTQAPYDMYDEYFSYVQENAPVGYPYSRAEAEKIGDTVCQALDNGATMDEIIKILEDTATTQADIKMYAVVLVGSVNYLCPEYKSELSSSY